MKRKSFVAVMAVMVLILYSNSVFSADVPALKGHINDYANVLSTDEEKLLEGILKTEEEKTSNQIVILTIQSLGDDSVEVYAQKVFNSWKIGQKSKNNGVLILLASKEREIRIHVGYGLEGSLPDGRCGEIIRTVMAPRFKEGKYYAGFGDACQKIFQSIRGEYKADGNKKETIVPFVVVVIILFIFSALAGFVHYSLGGLVGGIGAFCMTIYWIGSSLSYEIIFAIIGGLIGMLAKSILEALCEGSDSAGGSGSYYGGGSSGGGYSGGGGGSGGGGASGRF